MYLSEVTGVEMCTLIEGNNKRVHKFGWQIFLESCVLEVRSWHNNISILQEVKLVYRGEEHVCDIAMLNVWAVLPKGHNVENNQKIHQNNIK